MAGSDSSVHCGHHGEQEPPVAWAELHQLQNSLLEAMERMFNEHLPTAGNLTLFPGMCSMHNETL
jgi:hypothetical protein